MKILRHSKESWDYDDKNVECRDMTHIRSQKVDMTQKSIGVHRFKSQLFCLQKLYIP